ncbi:MAG: hypothetical protein K2M08_05605 [Anaeroplasmataceae bacterium]|nr:hypothetical protein [Anaeroplasmataceae bacterium]
METEKVLLEEISLESNYEQRKLSIQFWLKYLKKSWPVYIIIISFTILFVVLHLISGNVFQLYASIFYPIAVLMFCIGEGIYKNFKYLKNIEENLKSIQLSIYTTHLVLNNPINGINHSSELPFDIMEKIFYVAEKEEIVFEVRKKKYFTISKKDIKEETFEFLTTLFS